ncbi:hypothetical protein ABBQ38_15492 [Trebouxia sp. C0009 RCD-2024]
MRRSASFRRTTTAEDGDLALALSLEEAEGQRGTAAEPRAAHTDNWATLQSDGEICAGRATTAEPAPWIDEDDQLQRTVSQRLGSVKYSKHLPRVNSQPPSPEDSTTARARLLSRLDMYGLCEVSVHGDGNCQFRALSDQLCRTPDEHGWIRAAAIAQLRSFAHLYQDYIPENYQDYCQRMQQFGTWGDHVTLQAVADAFGVRIAIMTSYQDACVVEIQPQGQVKSQRILYLSFWAEVHYNSVYPQGDAPSQHSDSKVWGSKKLGRFIHAFAV